MNKSLAAVASGIVVKLKRKGVGQNRPAPIPSHPTKVFWGAVPFLAACAKAPEAKGNGRKRWRVSAGELRYLIALGAHSQRDTQTCFTSQGILAAKLGISRREAARYERSLADKGIIRIRRKPRHLGQFAVRVVEILMNAPLDVPEIESESVSDSKAATLPSRKAS